MRKKIVAGNWKMNKLQNEAKKLVNQVVALLQNSNLSDNKRVIFSPPSLYLESVSLITNKEAFISSCSQNIYFENSGAYTGELSAEMIKSVGCEYTLVGHSERRALFSETDIILAKKVSCALLQGIVPIYCCGELLAERKSKKHYDIIQAQIEGVLFHLSEDEFSNIIIAYEPVWAIGTGETASSNQAQEMHAFIRGLVTAKYGNVTSDNLTILYGGSCKPANAAELFACPDVDGGLIGGASLVAEDFVKIIDAL